MTEDRGQKNQDPGKGFFFFKKVSFASGKSDFMGL
jgi:hypothetical protein